MDHKLNDNYVIKKFSELFKSSPTVLVKAPGRVNLIGEHTDYNGLPVLPVSIPFTITVAVSSRQDKTIHIKNTSIKYKDNIFELSGDIPHSETGDWSNYVKAAVNELVSRPDMDFCGMNALFHGDIPNSAGLSSSSALVIASALSFLAANNVEMDLHEIGEAMAYGEHYVGTQGGGMDQAICLFGKKGRAVKIDFFPLKYSYVPFPENHSIIVANSLVRAAKTESAMMLYNRRPAECRLATAIVNALYKPDPPLKRLGDMKESRFFTDFSEPEEFVKNTFTGQSYSLPDIAGITEETPESLTKKYLLTRSGAPMPIPAEGFLLRQRAKHVLTEAERVEKSCAALEQNDASGFGELMNASHESCDKDYGISTPELNELVSIMRESGALGARLTGAGFGGCAVGLVRDENVDEVLGSVEKLYYNTYIKENRPELLEDKGADDTTLFTVKPADGAVVKQL